MKFMRSIDTNQLTYYSGLVMLFLGLGLKFSFGDALVWTGAALAVESVVTSYYATWMASRIEQPRRK